MEQTLGKRIVQNRRRLGLTQDALAEQLGVTAQAVSKWENDLSCPDISMLPKLAEIFGITTDALLGVERKEPLEAELVAGEEAPEESGKDREKDCTWEFKWDNSRRGHIGMALWVLLVGGLLLADQFYSLEIGFWSVLWPSGLLVFGLFGILPRPSFFRIGCLLFGLYFLLDAMHALPVLLQQTGILFPGILLLFGLSLLLDALRKPRHARFSIHHSGKNAENVHRSGCTVEGERFECATSFGSDRQRIDLPRLSGGEADVSFGELTVDLDGCAGITEGCRVSLNSAFGQLVLLVPRRYRVKLTTSTAFGAVHLKGEPDPEAEATIHVVGSASFGEILVRYI